MRDVAIYIIRHGETDWNRQGIVQGQLDVELNDSGRLQAEIVGKALKGIRFTHAFSSDLKRASETARIILKYQSSIPLEETPFLREKHLGKMQGLPTSEARRLLNEPDNQVETQKTMVTRLLTWWNNSIDPISSSGSQEDPQANVLVVSHGGPIGTLIPTLHTQFEFPSEVAIESGKRIFNASISLIESRVTEEGEGVQPCIVLYGDIRHLLTPKASDAGDIGDKDVVTTNDADAAVSTA